MLVTPSTSLYEQCNQEHGGESDYAVLQCITNAYEEAAQDFHTERVRWFLLLAAALVFSMQIGFATVCAGCVRKKNLQNTMLKNLLDACGAAIAFYTVGFAFAFGGQSPTKPKSFIGTENFFGTGEIDWAFWMFQFACSATTTTIVAGTLAERCKMNAYLMYSMLLAGTVYPVVAHALWSQNGILSISTQYPLFNCGAIDFSGSGVVHVTGGITSLIASVILGPRKGRFYDIKTGEPLEKPQVIPGHSVALQLFGTLVLWFGWFGFNPGSALLRGADVDVGTLAAVAATNTAMSGAVGGLSGLGTAFYLGRREKGESCWNLTAAMNGVLTGLVGVTSACGTIELWAAAVIGMVSGWTYLYVSDLLIRFKIDDVVDAIPVHLAGGCWGLIATGLFTSPAKLQAAFHVSEHYGWFYSWGHGSADATLLGCQILALLFIVGWATLLMGPFFYILSAYNAFRTNNLEELVGLDTVYHGGPVTEEEQHGAGSKQFGTIRTLLHDSAMNKSNGI